LRVCSGPPPRGCARWIEQVSLHGPEDGAASLQLRGPHRAQNGAGLLERKVRLRDVTRAIDALNGTCRGLSALVELRIVSDGRRVVVHTNDGAFEPLTGQMVLDLEVKALRDDVVRVLRPSPAASVHARLRAVLQASQSTRMRHHG